MVEAFLEDELESQRLDNIERMLDEHGTQLSGIRTTLEKVAVQHEQITSLQRNQEQLWQKYDTIVGQPGGVIPQIARHQASCPRKQVQWMWALLIPQGLVLIGLALMLVKGA